MESYLLTIALCVLGFYLLFSWITRNNDYFAKRGIHYVKPMPIFGSMWGAILQTQTFGETFEKIYYKLKPNKLGGFFEFTNPILMMTDPELIKEITVKNFDYFADRRVLMSNSTEPLFHRALPSLKGHEWREMRNTLSPAFTTSKLKGMFPLISRCGEQFVRFLLNRPNASNSPLEFKSTFTRYTNDVIATVAFGLECNAVNNSEEKFYNYGKELTSFIGLKVFLVFGYMLVPKLMEFFKVSITPAKIKSYFETFVRETIDYREKNNMSRPDMLQLLRAAQKGGIERTTGDEMDTGAVGEAEDATALHQKHLRPDQRNINYVISDEDVTAQAFIFFFAGYETVSVLLTFLAHEIAVNPEVQDQLRAEVDSAIMDNNGKISYDMIQKLKYLDMTVSETLRKYPPAGMTDRVCTKSFKVPNSDIVIEKDTIVMLPISQLHHDPEYFSEPNKFHPERFNEENKNNIRPYTYLPFGSGPHNCIGMRLALLEVKICIAYIVATCELKVNEKTEVPIKISKKSFMLNTDAGFWLTTAPRDNPSLKII